MSAHAGRCFRAWRRAVARKFRQGKPWDFPIRQKVPLTLRPFLEHIGRSATKEAFSTAMHRLAMAQKPPAFRRAAARGR